MPKIPLVVPLFFGILLNLKSNTCMRFFIPCSVIGLIVVTFSPSYPSWLWPSKRTWNPENCLNGLKAYIMFFIMTVHSTNDSPSTRKITPYFVLIELPMKMFFPQPKEKINQISILRSTAFPRQTRKPGTISPLHIQDMVLNKSPMPSYHLILPPCVLFLLSPVPSIANVPLFSKPRSCLFSILFSHNVIYGWAVDEGSSFAQVQDQRWLLRGEWSSVFALWWPRQWVFVIWFASTFQTCIFTQSLSSFIEQRCRLPSSCISLTGICYERQSAKLAHCWVLQYRARIFETLV